MLKPGIKLGNLKQDKNMKKTIYLSDSCSTQQFGTSGVLIHFSTNDIQKMKDILEELEINNHIQEEDDIVDSRIKRESYKKVFENLGIFLDDDQVVSQSESLITMGFGETSVNLSYTTEKNINNSLSLEEKLEKELLTLNLQIFLKLNHNDYNTLIEKAREYYGKEITSENLILYYNKESL